MKTIISTSLAGALFLAAGTTGAFADTPKVRDGWLSAGEVISRLETQGYSVQEIEVDDGYFEVKLITRNDAGRAMLMEADVNPTTGEIVRMKPDD